MIDEQMINEQLNVEKEEKKKKRKQIECKSCLKKFNARIIKKHSEKCHLYEKLIQNGLECSFCAKTFDSKVALKQHIIAKHNEILYPSK